MDSEDAQISTTLSSQDLSSAAYFSLQPDFDLSAIDLSNTNAIEGSTPKTSPFVSDVKIQDGLNTLPHPSNEEEARTAQYKDNFSFYDSKRFDLSDRPAEGSGSGSGFDGNRLKQDSDEVATISTDLSTLPSSTITIKGDDIGEKGRSTSAKTDADREITENGDEVEEKLGGEEISETGVREVDGDPEERVRQLNRTAGCDTLKETEGEPAAGKTTYTESGSGAEAESSFSWSEDVSGSGDGGGDGEGKKEDNKEDKAVAEKEGDGIDAGKEAAFERRDDLQLPVIGNKAKVEFPLFDSSEEMNNGGSDGPDEGDQNMTFYRSFNGGNLTPENIWEGDGDGKITVGIESEGGGIVDSDAGVIGESLQQFSGVDELFDAAGSSVLGPLIRVTDASEAMDEPKEGKCYTVCSFFLTTAPL
ncbi:sodium/potassium/calcium exchanger 1-like [Hippoglossus stenolepis]|uniref:sodium/potassium/calcium exchanger 1-like n=1 Tax=Hippoglossus stenolepis TaxID=195615 RepID=UPI001FAE90F4|nr:sodium/potassium/calcium exchanger 1-like [Hippoglossus stenolepis]